jgi:HEAT repeat protein
MPRLATLLSIKPNEGRMSALLIGIMLSTAFGAALGGTGIEALFFARFGTDYLPYMYIGLGVTAMITSFIVTAALGRIPKRIVYTAIPILIAALLVAARLALLTKLLWLYPVLWLGKEVLNALVSLMIWGVAGVVCDARQAKRLFPLFNASFILGQVIGGFATGALVNVIGAENLLLVWAGSLLLSFVFNRAVLASQQIDSPPQRKYRRKQPTLRDEMQRGFQYVRTSPLLVAISVSTIFFSILYFSLALPFSKVIAEQYPDENTLASFLGIFNGLTTAGAFLTSLFFANRLFARFGIMACIFAFQFTYVIGFSALIIAPFVSIVIVFRFVQMLLLSGIADPAWQTMFNVVPNEKRDQVRAFVGGVPEQAGVFIAGGILVIGEQALNPQQLYIIGFIAALCCTYLILKAWRGYNLALVDALRAGRPQLFFSEEQPFGGFRQDATAAQAALNGLRDPDPLVRRVSAEIVGHLSLPESTPALIAGLSDTDALVRLASLKALSHSQATPALLDIAASLSDVEPDVRAQAVSALAALSPRSPALTHLLLPLLEDENARVSTTAALKILQFSNSPGEQNDSWRPSRLRGEEINKAIHHLRHTAALGDLEERLLAIEAMGAWGDLEAFQFLVNELKDRQLDAIVKNSILTALAKINAPDAIPYLLDSLKDISSHETSARLLGEIGASVTDAVIHMLNDEPSAEGALRALEFLPPPPPKPILEFARGAVNKAGEYDALRRGVNLKSENEALHLLEQALHEKSHQAGVHALRAIGLLGDRDAMNLAVENLSTRDANSRANVIETLESISAKYRDIIQPLTKLWEDDHTQAAIPNTNWARLLADSDSWIRDCAAYAAHQLGEHAMENLATLSLMDRILCFRRVPLFANLSTLDLKQVAALAEEEVFSDGEELCREGEVGDMLFVIVKGVVKIFTERNGIENEIARRNEGDVVGEMAIIGREPRSASMKAVGDVRTLCIDQKSFEGLIRERPDVSLAVMQVLSQRLKEATVKK